MNNPHEIKAMMLEIQIAKTEIKALEIAVSRLAHAIELTLVGMPEQRAAACDIAMDVKNTMNAAIEQKEKYKIF